MDLSVTTQKPEISTGHRIAIRGYHGNAPAPMTANTTAKTKSLGVTGQPNDQEPDISRRASCNHASPQGPHQKVVCAPWLAGRIGKSAGMQN